MGVDPERVCVLGESAGAAAVLHAALHPASGVRCAIAYYPQVDASGYVEVEPSWSPVEQVRRLGADAPPLLVAFAGNDVPGFGEPGEELVRVARSSGADVTRLVQPTGGHGWDAAGPSEDGVRTVRQTLVWLHQHLAVR